MEDNFVPPTDPIDTTPLPSEGEMLAAVERRSEGIPSRPNTGLSEEIKRKKEQEKNALKKILEKQEPKSNLVEEQPVVGRIAFNPTPTILPPPIVTAVPSAPVVIPKAAPPLSVPQKVVEEVKKPTPKITEGPDFFTDMDQVVSEALNENYGKPINLADINNAHQKALVSKLLSAADEIRGTSIKDDKEELPSSKPSTVLMEETKEETVDLHEISRLALYVSSLKEECNSEKLESFEDNLLNFIAESLLLNRNTISKEMYEALIARFNEAIEG